MRGLREQGPADRDPLLLAAGERRGLACEQCVEAEKVDHPRALDQALGRRAQALPVGEVRLDGQMRKEQRVLEDVADAPALRRDIDPLLRIEQHGVVDADRAPRRLADAGDGVDHGRLARAGAAEEAEDRRIRDEPDREAKISECRLDVNVDHRLASVTRGA